MSQVRLTDGTKVYDDVLAVKEVDLTVEDGGSVVMVGPAGGRKPTTLPVTLEAGAYTLGGRPADLDVATADVNFFDETDDRVLLGDEPGPMTTA